VSRQAFAECARAIGLDPIAEEDAILSVGREFLPACALAVLDGSEPTEEYWAFMIAQTTEAHEEHDREYAAGNEWNGGER
jgi:hypothetical protein